MGDDFRHVEDHGAGVSGLHALAVDVEPHVEVLRVANLVTSDEIRDPQNLDMWLDVNGKRMQTGNTRTMIFNVAKIISHVSHYMTLLPGDIITLRIQGLGEQRQKVVAYAA